MKCPDLQNRLSAYQDRELAADKAQDIAKHLKVCDICRKEYETLQTIDHLLSGLPGLTVSGTFHKKLKKNLNRQRHCTKPDTPIRHPLLFIKNLNRIDTAFHPDAAIQPKRCPGRVLRFTAKFHGQNIFYADLNTPDTRQQRFQKFWQRMKIMRREL